MPTAPRAPRTTLAALRSRLGADAARLVIRGRVESAIFTCPGYKDARTCGAVLRFRSRTAYVQRCPVCGTRMGVFLRIVVEGKRGSLAPGADTLRPADTIVPLIGRGRGGKSREREIVDMIDPATSEPESVAPETRLLADPLPEIEVDRWMGDRGELAHRIDYAPED